LEGVFPSKEIQGRLNLQWSLRSFPDLFGAAHTEWKRSIKEKLGLIYREKFFPRDPDLLYKNLGAKKSIIKRAISKAAEHFFGALALMTPEERRLLVTAIRMTCPAGPLHNNVHLNISLLGRATGLSSNEIISTLERLDCVGINARLEKRPVESDDICKMRDIVYIKYEPASPDIKIKNATYVAIKIIDVIFNHFCKDCGMKLIDRLDFSILSSKTGFPEKEIRKKRKLSPNLAINIADQVSNKLFLKYLESSIV
jgi:hypothetical protein